MKAWPWCPVYPDNIVNPVLIKSVVSFKIKEAIPYNWGSLFYFVCYILKKCKFLQFQLF